MPKTVAPMQPVLSFHPAIQALLPLLGIDPAHCRGFTLNVESGECVMVEVRNYLGEDQAEALLPIVDRYELQARPAPVRPRLKLYEGETPYPLSPEEIRARLAPFRVQVSADPHGSQDAAPLSPTEGPVSDWLDGLHRP